MSLFFFLQECVIFFGSARVSMGYKFACVDCDFRKSSMTRSKEIIRNIYSD